MLLVSAENIFILSKLVGILEAKKVTKTQWSRNILAKMENKMECYQCSSLVKNFPKMKSVFAKWTSDHWIILAQCFHTCIGEWASAIISNTVVAAIWFISDLMSSLQLTECCVIQVLFLAEYSEKNLTWLGKQSLTCNTEVKWLSVVTWHTSYFTNVFSAVTRLYKVHKAYTTLLKLKDTDILCSWTKLVTDLTLE